MTAFTLNPPQSSALSRGVLGLAGLIAVAIAATILVAPGAFYAGYGIDVVGNATLASELKAPSFGLLVTGVLMLTGVVRRDFLVAGLAIATLVYLSYGLGRVASILLDGLPHSGMIAAAIIELVIGSACLAAWRRVRNYQS